MPTRFEYLSESVHELKRIAGERLISADVRNLPAIATLLLARMAAEISQREDWEAIASWLMAPPSRDYHEIQMRDSLFPAIEMMLRLGDAGQAPFVGLRERVEAASTVRLEWGGLPAELEFLAEAAVRLQTLATEEDVAEKAESLTPEEAGLCRTVFNRLRAEPRLLAIAKEWADRNASERIYEVGLLEGTLDLLNVLSDGELSG